MAIVPVIALAATLPALADPVTFRDASVPTEVMLGWAAVLRVPVMVLAATLSAAMLAATSSEDRAPTEVMVGWDGVVRVPPSEELWQGKKRKSIGHMNGEVIQHPHRYGQGVLVDDGEEGGANAAPCKDLAVHLKWVWELRVDDRPDGRGGGRSAFPHPRAGGAVAVVVI